MFNPPHPGEVIRSEIIEGHNLTVTAAAKVLGVSRQALSTLLNAQADLSGDMALATFRRKIPDLSSVFSVEPA
jgi:addiction module HigA family antidote